MKPQRMNPAFALFLVQLALLTEIDEEALFRWMRRCHTALLIGFKHSGRPEDEAGIWVREQYVRTHLGVTL